MRLKYLSALIFGVVLSLPVQAQVYLDSTEVANILHPKAVTAVQPKVTSTANDVSEEEEDTDSIIPAFTTDSHLSWKENITARLDGILRSPLLETVQTSVMVWDLTDDVPVYQFRERLHMRPASTMKCVTALQLSINSVLITTLRHVSIILVRLTTLPKCCVATSIVLVVWTQCSPHQT